MLGSISPFTRPLSAGHRRETYTRQQALPAQQSKRETHRSRESLAHARPKTASLWGGQPPSHATNIEAPNAQRPQEGPMRKGIRQKQTPSCRGMQIAPVPLRNPCQFVAWILGGRIGASGIVRHHGTLPQGPKARQMYGPGPQARRMESSRWVVKEATLPLVARISPLPSDGTSIHFMAQSTVQCRSRLGKLCSCLDNVGRSGPTLTMSSAPGQSYHFRVKLARIFGQARSKRFVGIGQTSILSRVWPMFQRSACRAWPPIKTNTSQT